MPQGADGLSHIHCGAAQGRLVVYFHGVPGSPQEVQLFHPAAQRYGLRLLSQDRLVAAATLQGEAYFQALARDVAQLAQGQALDLLGFSLGTFVALQVCRYLPDQVQRLHLISPAAPLEAGDFLPQMAGRQVFAWARQRPQLFRGLTALQARLARWYPRLLYRMLFASATGADHALRGDADFRAARLHDLQHSFLRGTTGYQRDVRAYVTPWQARVAPVQAQTWLWHGELDNWSPPAMSTWLQQQLPHCEGRHLLPGHSHYSTLYAAAPQICRLLAE